MEDNRITCIHRSNTKNIGDLNSTPYLYFPELRNRAVLDIRGYLAFDGVSPDDVKLWLAEVYQSSGLIVGGGGLFNLGFFGPCLESILNYKRKSAKTVVWGAGHNNNRLESWNAFKIEPDARLQEFDLVGIRDFGVGYEWVPCVSCLSPLFDRSFGVTRELGIFAQDDLLSSPMSQVTFGPDISVQSNLSSFEEAIQFLGSCETVMTDSYHGAYWATLLGRRVIAFPSSEKFYGYKHPVALCHPQDWRRHLKLATSYSEALEECRDANRRFSQRVFDHLGL